MTYARARLLLGISSVGTIVIVTMSALVLEIPQRVLPTTSIWTAGDVMAIAAFVFASLLLSLPFDIMGGFVLPRRFKRSEIGLSSFFTRWLRGVSVQATLFVITGMLILAAGRFAGVVGAVAVVASAILAFLVAQGSLSRVLLLGECQPDQDKLNYLREQLAEWQLSLPDLVVLNHSDPGFTGGVVGLPGCEKVILPMAWFDMLSPNQLATAVARRIEAIQSGSRAYGLLLAIAWVLIGFYLATLMPNAGVRSAAGLATTCCGFTCWTFWGLLVLPTASRAASYTVDMGVLQRGVSTELLHETLAAIDRQQDDEPERSAFVEAIFHPVPSVSNRRERARTSQVGAWHAARTTLFLSWACLGFLSRAVHCNAGRPELWALLPTD